MEMEFMLTFCGRQDTVRSREMKIAGQLATEATREAETKTVEALIIIHLRIYNMKLNWRDVNQNLQLMRL